MLVSQAAPGSVPALLPDSLGVSDEFASSAVTPQGTGSVILKELTNHGSSPDMGFLRHKMGPVLKAESGPKPCGHCSEHVQPSASTLLNPPRAAGGRR